MKKGWIALAALLASPALAQTTEDKSNPGSLYRGAGESVFLDRTARKVGDILQVVIEERSTAAFSAKTDAAKEDASRVGFNLFNTFLDSLFKPLLNGVSSTSKVTGNGQTSQNGQMAARMSVVVKAVMPNGNLVIEGRRSLVTNRETQTFVLSGIVRPIDISGDNSVRSPLIAEADIRMEGKGMIQDRQRKGILTRLLDWLF